MRRSKDAVWKGSATAHIMEGVKVAFVNTSALDKFWVAHELDVDISADLRDAARRARCNVLSLKLAALWFTECPLFMDSDGSFTAGVPQLAALIMYLGVDHCAIGGMDAARNFETLCGHPLGVRDYPAAVSAWAGRVEHEVTAAVKVRRRKNVGVDACVQVQIAS